MLAEVKTLYESNNTDIAAMLRLRADKIERGEDTSHQMVLVAVGETIEMYGFGQDMPSERAHFILSMGLHKLMEMSLHHYETDQRS